MNSKDRRKHIKELLIKNDKPQKGQQIAENLGVTRQVIVKDIAILRAEGNNIIATPDGYMCPKELESNVKRIIAVSHEKGAIKDELECIIKFGGVIKDVIIEHPLYGEIRAMIMVKTAFDIQNFMNKLNKYDAKPLSKLTNGVHLHTIQAEDEDIMDKIINELKLKGYLITDN